MLYTLLFTLLLLYTVNTNPIDQCAPYLNSILTDIKLGSGAQGTVYEGLDPDLGHVAIKFGNERYDLKKEIEITEKLNNYMKESLLFDGFVRLYKVVPCSTFNLISNKPEISNYLVNQFVKLYMIMEKLDGSLKHRLEMANDISTFGSLLAQSFYVLERSFKDLGFIHGDINTGNIMIKKEKPSKDQFYVIPGQDYNPLYLPKAATQNDHIKLIDFGRSNFYFEERVDLHMRDCSALLDAFLRSTPNEFLLKLKSQHQKEYQLLNDLYFRQFEHLNQNAWSTLQIKKENFDLIWLKEFTSYFANRYELMMIWKRQPIELYRFLDHEFFHHLFAHKI